MLASDRILTPDLLLLGRQETQSPQNSLLPFKEARAEFERSYLVQVLTATRGNVSRAAGLAGRYRAEFYKMLRKHAVDPQVFKAKDTPI